LDEVCDIFNNYFVNVAKNIGNKCTKIDDAHPSIVEIKNNHPDLALAHFSFSEIDEEFVGKRISKINVKKATGIDGISPKLLHFAKPVLLQSL
jgi:hypothetical protein